MRPALLARIAAFALLAAALGGCGMLSFGKKSGAGSEGPDAALAVAQVRTEFNQLKADPELATRVPAAMEEADQAVQAAEGASSSARAHFAYIAGRKVQVARALAEARQAEDQTGALRGPQP